ncbi:MAG TPA: patatin-like phospholipase family protein [Nitrospirota bacterium]|nr:patatin-like phospholipase family protein [Nitrospirota bacterium]
MSFQLVFFENAGDDMTPSRQPRIGLALSGGAARGIAHIAVLEALEQEGIPIHAIAGTSAGSVVGAFYCAGMTVREIKEVLLKARWKNVFTFTVPRLGLISGEGIFRFMEEHLPIRKFSSLQIPFAAVATDLHTGEKVSLLSGSIARAVQASCSLPVIFTPAEINKKLLIDGGVSSQVPVRTAREELKADRVVAVNVNYKAVELDTYDSLLTIAAHLSALWASRNAREEEKLADVVVNVNAKGIALYDLSHAEDLLKRGEKAAQDKMAEIRALI